MSQMPKHMKLKRTQKRVLVKRSHFLKGYPEIKSYKPLCKKLQNNNTLLAKALNKEKQECQLLFSQNVALIAEVQNLGLACSNRDAVISNVLKNAKEMLQMLVSLTGYLTNTISCCQQYTKSNDANMPLSCHSTSRKESFNRLSGKSPTRGIVKPMVSGYTITKPTINLNRINMQHINNSSNLSIIPEVGTPSRDDEFNSLRSSNSMSLRQNGVEIGRTCRMPERLTALQRESDESERRVSERKKSRHSKRMSGRLSKSKSRSSKSSSSRHSIENLEYIGSPRVKLNDVSKLLQNSQSINVRMLTENQNMDEANSSENNYRHSREHSQGGVIPETPPSDDTINDIGKTIEENMDQSNSDMNITGQEEKANVKKTKDRSSNWEDPLEGPSWLFNTSQQVPFCVNKDNKTDDLDVSNTNMTNTTLNVTKQNNTLKAETSSSQILSQSASSKQGNSTKSHKNISQIGDENECSILDRSEGYDSLCSTSTVSLSLESNGNQYAVEHVPPTMNYGSFVTSRRGCFESDDEDDFTLMLPRHPRNMNFDINDLKLPVLEQSALKPVIPVETEPEITTTLRQISQIVPIPSITNNSLNETMFDQSTVNLPLLQANDYNNKNEVSPKKKINNLQQKKKNKMPLRNSNNIITVDSVNSKKNSRKKTKEKVAKDPSVVKVVLQKLNESNVNSRISSADETTLHDSNISLSPVSLPADNSRDADCNISSNGVHIVKRPRRKRAPINLQEPSLIKKLRRSR